MKAIVFGGSGFLGSYVADTLVDNGYDVAIYDLKLSQYLRKPQIMVVGDILDEAKVQQAMKGCQIVYNFAGIADIDEASEDPLKTVKYNILGNTIILEACRREKVKRFVFASSLYVYSKSGSVYRSTKQACELLTENYYETYKVPYTILRYGSLYGQRADEKCFIYRIIKEAINEGRISRYGDGEEIREYIHALDAAKASVEILSEEFLNQNVIITGNQQVKIKDLLVMIKEMFDNKIKIEFLPPQENFHYEITPFSFTPRTGKRLTHRTYLDLSQGILEVIYDLHKKVK